MTACIVELKAESNYVTRNSQADRGTNLKGVNPNSPKSKTSYSFNLHRASGFSEFFSCIKPLSKRKTAVLAVVVNCFLKMLGYHLTPKNSTFGFSKKQPVAAFKAIKKKEEPNGNLSAQNSQSSKLKLKSSHRAINVVEAAVRSGSPSEGAYFEFAGVMENPINATIDCQINKKQKELQTTVFDNTSDEELAALIAARMCYI